MCRREAMPPAAEKFNNLISKTSNVIDVYYQIYTRQEKRKRFKISRIAELFKGQKLNHRLHQMELEDFPE